MANLDRSRRIGTSFTEVTSEHDARYWRQAAGRPHDVANTLLLSVLTGTLRIITMVTYVAVCLDSPVQQITL